MEAYRYVIGTFTVFQMCSNNYAICQKLKTSKLCKEKSNYLFKQYFILSETGACIKSIIYFI